MKPERRNMMTLPVRFTDARPEESGALVRALARGPRSQLGVIAQVNPAVSQVSEAVPEA